MDIDVLKTLACCPLFHHLDETDIESALQDVGYRIVHFDKGDVYALMGDPCKYADIIVKGEMTARMGGMSGKFVEVTTLRPGNMIAPAFIYAKNNSLPVSVEPETGVDLLRLSADSLRLLMGRNERIEWNFIEMLSNINVFLTSKMRFLSLLSVREKVASLILEQVRRQGSRTITLDKSRQEIADTFGIQKFSLIRELKTFQEEGVIEMKGKTITILKPSSLSRHA